MLYIRAVVSTKKKSRLYGSSLNHRIHLKYFSSTLPKSGIENQLLQKILKSFWQN